MSFAKESEFDDYIDDDFPEAQTNMASAELIGLDRNFCPAQTYRIHETGLFT